MQAYDAEVHAGLVTRKAELSGKLEDVSKALNEFHETDKAFSDEDRETFTTKQQIHAQLTRELGVVTDELRAMELTQPERVKASNVSALSRFLAKGNNGLEAWEIEAHQPNEDSASILGGANCEGFTIKSATRSDDASGQNLVDDETRPTIVDKLAYYGAVGRMCRTIQTATGNKLRFPQLDDSGEEGQLIANQNTAITEQNLANVGIVEFGSDTMSSEFITLTREMIQDSIVAIGPYAEMLALRRMGRGWNKAFTQNALNAAGGDGLINTAKAGVTSAAAHNAAAPLAWGELVDLEDAVDRAYLEGDEGEYGLMDEVGGGRTGYMVHRKFETILKKMVDSDGRPIWRPNTREDAPSTILGYPYEVNNHLAAPAAGAVSALFGNFGHYGCRMVGDVEVFRFWDSGTAAKNTVKVLALSRRFGHSLGPDTSNLNEAYAKFTWKT